MLASINPLGERARGTRFARTFAWYVAGSAAGGALLGAVLGLAGDALGAALAPSDAARAWLVVAVCVIGFVLDLGLGGLHLPTPRRQVNENWLAVYRGWIYGSGFGFQLGLGVVTIVTTSAVYVMLALEALSESVVAGATIGLVFGVARALPLLVVGRIDEPSKLRTVMRRVQSLASAADRVALATTLALPAAAALALAI